LSTKITGTYSATVTLTSLISPLTVTGSGLIDPSADSARGVYLPTGQSGVAKIVNDGRILGAGGAYSQYYLARYGGNGVVALSGVNLSNAGTIAGGSGGGYGETSSQYPAGPGGSGVLISSTVASTLTNSGHIYGGNGGSTDQYGGEGGTGVFIDSAHGQVSNSGIIRGGDGGSGNLGNGGAGGDGVFLESATMQNTGMIIGGTGGYTYSGHYTQGGYGTFLYHAVLTNKAVITGGQGGESANGHGGQGGNGVEIAGSTLINAGTVSGGAGGYSEYYHSTGPIGNAVELFGSVAGTVVVDPGAVFFGDVVVNNSYGTAMNVLEVAGTSSVALTGIGTRFDGFAAISFASGAAWKIEGTAAALTTGEKITGFGKADKIEITDAAASGKVSVKTNGVVTIKAGGETYELDIAGAKKGGTDFKFSNQTLTKTGSSKMAFITPPAAGAPPDSLPALHQVATVPAKPEAGGWITQAAPGAALPDLTRIPHGAVQAMVTLQSG
jgi:hypothetical protein